MIGLELQRQFFAEEIAAIANLTTPGLVDALASVPRERFLPPGPWWVRGEGARTGSRYTRDDDPRHVYHNYSIALDSTRELFNGAPGIVTPLIDMLAIKDGSRVLHVGVGTGYYSAIIGHLVGMSGRVLAIEVDEALASRARENVSSIPAIEVRQGHGAGSLGEPFDAILVNAGVTHPHPGWLDGLTTGGRLILPLTATMPGMGSLSKGFTALIRRVSDDVFEARPLALVMIYAAVGLRNDSLNQQLSQAMMRSPFPPFTRLRRDVHESGPACWLHSTDFCFCG